MPQKPLFKKKGASKAAKPAAANRHGKGIVQRKGKFLKPPKGEVKKKDYKEKKEMTAAINRKNEGDFAGKAEQLGGSLGVVKAPPPEPRTQNKKRKAVVAVPGSE